MGFYLAAGGKNEDILAVTAGHVLFPSDEANIDYARTNSSTRRKEVLLMGAKAFKNLLTSGSKSIVLCLRSTRRRLRSWRRGWLAMTRRTT